MAILQLLQSVDESLFQLINVSMDHPWLDTVLTWFRNKYFWVPLYVFLIVKTVLHYKEFAYIMILTSVLAVSIADNLSSSVIKPLTERARPCNNSKLVEVRVKAPCRSSYSFVSSHASNHFAVALFYFILLGFRRSNWWKLLFLWAALICLAQVYVGLHYPSDVLVGGLLGLVVSWLLYKLLDMVYLSSFNVTFED